MKLDLIKKIYKENGFELSEDIIASFNDPELAYEYSNENGYFERLSKIVINSKDPKYNFYYARDIKDANAKEHERVVIESNNPYFSILFASFVPNASIKELRQIVLKSKDPYLNYYFALLIIKKGLDLDIKPHEKIVLQSKNPEWNFQFVTIPGANIIAHGNVIYKSGDKRWIDAFNGCFKERYENEKGKVKILK